MIASAIVTGILVIILLASTVQCEAQGSPGPEAELMKKVIEGDIQGQKFFPLNVLAVISLLWFVGLSMVLYFVTTYVTERKK